MAVISSYTDKVRPRTIKSCLSALGSGGRSFEEGSHLCFMYFKKRRKKEKKRKIEQCHKLLLVLGGLVLLTRSYSERWQVARIGMCGSGAVCGALKMLNCPLAASAGDF